MRISFFSEVFFLLFLSLFIAVCVHREYYWQCAAAWHYLNFVQHRNMPLHTVDSFQNIPQLISRCFSCALAVLCAIPKLNAKRKKAHTLQHRNYFSLLFFLSFIFFGFIRCVNRRQCSCFDFEFDMHRSIVKRKKSNWSKCWLQIKSFWIENETSESDASCRWHRRRRRCHSSREVRVSDCTFIECRHTKKKTTMTRKIGKRSFA